MTIDYFKYTHQGGRISNEDSIETIYLHNSFISCIADGVGGESCGEIASQKSIAFFISFLEKNDFKQAFINTNLKIKDLQNELNGCKKMASTLSCCIISENHLQGIHTGDSRISILRGNGFKQLTEDHTEINQLLKSGKLKLEDAHTYPRKHVIYSAIGTSRELAIHIFDYTLQTGDRILLTTDGVHDVISKLEFRDLSISTENIEEFGNGIIDLLKTKMITDNVSFIAISVR